MSANGIHVNAYFGDVNGNHNIEGLDKLAIDNVAQGRATGFSAYALLDPVIVGDVAGDHQIDAGDVSLLDAYVVQLQPPQIPVPPGLSGISSPNAADPTLSLVSGEELMVSGGNNSPLTTNPSQDIVVSVQLDQPHPAGSTGLTSAILALKYDPSVLSVTPADITLGTIPSMGAGWQIYSIIDPNSGQIAIFIYSSTPITDNLAGSLVNIAFHVKPGATASFDLGATGRFSESQRLPNQHSACRRPRSLDSQRLIIFVTQITPSPCHLVLFAGTTYATSHGRHFPFFGQNAGDPSKGRPASDSRNAKRNSFRRGKSPANSLAMRP